MRVGRFWPGLGLCALFALTGCSGRENAKLAEFKDHVITVKEYETAYTKVDVAYLPKTTGTDGIRDFLTTMLNKEVMVAKADELGYDKDPSVAQAMTNFTRMSLPIAYLKKQVADKITVTDEEVKRHYDNLGAAASVKQILTDTEEEAQAAYQALKGGMDFETACRQFSKTPDAASGGMVLNVSYGTLVSEVQNMMFSTPVGQYTEPIFTPYGWIIVKVISRIEGKHGRPFEEMKEKLKAEVRSSKEQVELNKFTDKLREDYGVVWNYDNLLIAFNALPPDRPFEEAPARDTEVYPLLYFDPKDLDRPLVTYKEKSITIRDFSDMYDQASFYQRPRRNYRLGGIRSFLTEVIMNDISADIVSTSGIDKDPEVAAVLKAKREELMINLLYDDMINKQTVVTLEEEQTYYNDNLAMYNIPPKRKFGVILTGDLETAKKARAELVGGRGLGAVANAYSTDEITRGKGGVTELMPRGDNPEIDGPGWALPRIGAVSEPFQTSRGWVVLKLVEDEKARVFSFAEAQSTIEGTLKQRANDKRLNELLAKWKEELGVVIYEKNFKKVKVTERVAATEQPAEKPAAEGG